MSLLLLTYNFMHFLWILLLLQQMFCKPILLLYIHGCIHCFQLGQC